MGNDLKGHSDHTSSEHARQGLTASNDEDRRPWRVMSFEVLKKLVVEAKGEASRKVINFIKDNLGDTKLVFVVGQSGTGKTRLLKELTGINLKEGKGVMSGTRQHHVCPAIIDDDQYIFVDTPGLGVTDVKSCAAFVDIVGCLNGLGPFVDIAGLLFVYGGEQARFGIEDLRTVQWVQCFCGPQFYRNIVLVTTKWDSTRPGGFVEMWGRIEELFRLPVIATLLDPPGRYIGATTYRHGLPGGVGTIDGYKDILEMDEHLEQRSAELKALITRSFKYSPIVKLQVAEEMGAKGDWTRTEAAKVLRSDPTSITIEIQDNRAVVRPVASPSAFKAAAGAETATLTHNNATPGTAPRHSSEEGTRGAQGTQKTWYQSLQEWLNVARAAAAFFAEARAKPKDKKGGGDKGASQSWFSIWNDVRGWWSGTS